MMVNERHGKSVDGPSSESVVQGAMAALATNSLGMTQQERVAIAVELFRLADTVTIGPTADLDAKVKAQAEQRMAWLLRWLEQAAAPTRPTDPESIA